MRRPGNAQPVLIKAKYAGKCACGKAIQPGDEMLYFPPSRKGECRDCATSTLEMLADESGGY